MLEDKELSGIKNKFGKSLGVSEITKKGGEISVQMDFSSLKPRERKQILDNLGSIRPDFKKTIASWDKWSNSENHDGQFFKAEAASVSQAPIDASFFEGAYSSFTGLPIHQKMQLAMKYFHSEPLVGKTIELMKIFSNDGFKNEHGNKKIKRFYDNWANAVNFDQVLGWLFLEYYRSGNVVTWRELIQYKAGMFEGGSDPLLYADAAKKHDWTKKMIPMVYTVLNPLTVFANRADGYNDSLYFSSGPQRDNVVKEGNSLEDPTRILLRQLPHDLIKQVEQSKNIERIPLASKNVKRILRMRQPYEPYGMVLMERAFAPIYEKNKMRQMDLSMINSIVNQIITVTIGNNDFPATPKQLNNLMNAFKNVGKSQILFWNHTLRVEVIRPDIKVFNKEKYERIDEDIRNSFGISEVLTGGGNVKTNFAIAYLSLKAFISNLIEGRNDILRWVKQEYRDIAEAMQFDSYPIPSFNPMSLTDEVAEKQILMQLVDRKIISYESAQIRLGFEPTTELERMKVEQPLIAEGLLGLNGSPYQQSGKMDDKLVGGKRDVNSTEERDRLIKAEDKKQADTRQSEELIRERKEGNSLPSPSKITANPVFKGIDGDKGRPKTPRGNYPEQRKLPKIKGQSSE